MDTRAAHGGEPGALATLRAKAARPEVVGSNPTGPTNNCNPAEDDRFSPNDGKQNGTP